MQSPALIKSVIWSVGFRAFFWSASAFAALIVPVWLGYLTGHIHHNHYQTWWHGHEMIFGFLAAVFGGFLLTAVQNWTGRPTATGILLFYLWVLWLVARFLPWCTALKNHPILIAAVDVMFLPCLSVAIATPIVAQKQVRNYGFPVALLLLGATNTAFHWSLITQQNHHITHLILHMSLLIILWIIIKLGCRVIPFFTEKGLALPNLKRNPTHDLWCEAAVLFIIPAALMHQSGFANAALIMAAAIIGSRACEWFSPRIFKEPLVWILHVAFAWLLIGLLLLVLEGMQLLPYSGAWHAITIGFMGSITIGMMARISLGHTGRALMISGWITLAFLLIQVSAALRVIAAYLPVHFSSLTIMAGITWSLAFLLFAIVYTPILLKARPHETSTLC